MGAFYDWVIFVLFDVEYIRSWTSIRKMMYFYMVMIYGNNDISSELDIGVW